MSGLCTPVLLFWSSRVAEDPLILLRKRRHSVTIAFGEPYKFALGYTTLYISLHLLATDQLLRLERYFLISLLSFPCYLSFSPSLFGIVSHNYCQFVFDDSIINREGPIVKIRYLQNQALFSDITNDVTAI